MADSAELGKKLRTDGVMRGPDGRILKGSKTPNPGGRPRGLASQIREALGDGADLVEFLRVVIAGEIKASVRDRIEAAKVALDRGWGKAVETSVQVTLDAQGANKLELTPDQLKLIADTLRPPRGAIVEGQATVMDTEVRVLAPIPPDSGVLPE